MAFVGLLQFVLDACSMFQVVAVVSGVGVLFVRVGEGACTVHGSRLEIAFVANPAVPGKLAKSMFLSFEVLSFIRSLVVMFLAVAVGLFVEPLPFILDVVGFIGIDAFVGA